MKTKYEGSRIDDGGKHNKDASYAAYMKKTKYRGGGEELEVEGEASIIRAGRGRGEGC